MDSLPGGALFRIVLLGEGEEWQVLRRLVYRVNHSRLLVEVAGALIGVETSGGVVLGGLGCGGRQGGGGWQLHRHWSSNGA